MRLNDYYTKEILEDPVRNKDEIIKILDLGLKSNYKILANVLMNLSHMIEYLDYPSDRVPNCSYFYSKLPDMSATCKYPEKCVYRTQSNGCFLEEMLRPRIIECFEGNHNS